MIPVKLIVAGAIAAASFAGAWSIQENRYERKLAEISADQATALAAATANALAETQRLQAAKDEAERLAAIRQSALARDLAANRDALGRLSHAADESLRRASSSHEACLATANSQRDVFAQCSTRLVEVGAAADRHASDVKTLVDAWPKE